MTTLEQIPAWAVELTRQVTILNERLPNHIDTTEKNLADQRRIGDDHEARLRASEATLQSLTDVVGRLNGIEKRVRETERKLWMAYGGLSVIVLILETAYRFTGK
jgi:hypothetical protein